jgi:WD40 repeat protein
VCAPECVPQRALMAWCAVVFKVFDFDESGLLSYDETVLACRSLLQGLCKLTLAEPPTDAQVEACVAGVFRGVPSMASRTAGLAEEPRISKSQFVSAAHTNAYLRSWLAHHEWPDTRHHPALAELRLAEQLASAQVAATSVVTAVGGTPMFVGGTQAPELLPPAPGRAADAGPLDDTGMPAAAKPLNATGARQHRVTMELSSSSMGESAEDDSLRARAVRLGTTATALDPVEFVNLENDVPLRSAAEAAAIHPEGFLRARLQASLDTDGSRPGLPGHAFSLASTMLASREWVDTADRLVPPDAPPVSRSPPDVTMSAEWVYGYRNRSCRQTVQYIHSGALVYPAGTLCVVRDLSGGMGHHSQSFFASHADEVTCIAPCVLPSGSETLVASCEAGLFPCVRVWRASNCSELASIRLPVNSRGLTHVAWAPDCRRIAVVCNNRTRTVHILRLSGPPSLWETVPDHEPSPSTDPWAASVPLLECLASVDLIPPCMSSPDDDDVNPIAAYEASQLAGAEAVPFFATTGGAPGSFSEGVRRSREGKNPADLAPRGKVLGIAWVGPDRVAVVGVQFATFVEPDASIGGVFAARDGIFGRFASNVVLTTVAPHPRGIVVPADSTDSAEERMLSHAGAVGAGAWSIAGTLTGELVEFDGVVAVRSILAHDGPVTCLSCVPGIGLASGGLSDQRVKFFEGEGVTPTRIMEMHPLACAGAGVQSLQWDPMNDRLLVGTTAGELFELVASSGASVHPEGAVMHAHYSGMTCAFSAHPEVDEFVTGGDDGTVKVWDALDRRLLRSLRLPAAIRCMAFHPSGEFLAIGLGSPQGTERASVLRPADRKQYPSLAEAARREGAYMILRYSDLSTVHIARDSRRWIRSVAFSPDGRTLAVGSSDGTVFLYDSSLPKSKASLGGSKQANLGDMETPPFLPKGKCSGHRAGVCWIDFSEDGGIIRTACCGTEDDDVPLRGVTGGHLSGGVVAETAVRSSLTQIVPWKAPSTGAEAEGLDLAVRRVVGEGWETLFWNAETGEPAKVAAVLKHVTWARETGPMSWHTRGVWPRNGRGFEAPTSGRVRDSGNAATRAATRAPANQDPSELAVAGQSMLASTAIVNRAGLFFDPRFGPSDLPEPMGAQAWVTPAVYADRFVAVSSVSRSFSGDLLASIDSYGRLRLHRYPADDWRRAFLEFRGACPGPGIVNFSSGDGHLFAMGNRDGCVIQYVVDFAETDDDLPPAPAESEALSERGSEMPSSVLPEAEQEGEESQDHGDAVISGPTFDEELVLSSFEASRAELTPAMVVAATMDLEARTAWLLAHGERCPSQQLPWEFVVIPPEPTSLQLEMPLPLALALVRLSRPQLQRIVNASPETLAKALSSSFGKVPSVEDIASLLPPAAAGVLSAACNRIPGKASRFLRLCASSSEALLASATPFLRRSWMFGATLQRSRNSVRYVPISPSTVLDPLTMRHEDASEFAGPAVVWPAGRTIVIARKRRDGSGWSQCYFNGHLGPVQCITVGSDPSTGRVVVASGSKERGGGLRVWSAEGGGGSGSLVADLSRAHHRGVSHVAFRPHAEGRRSQALLASVGMDARHRVMVHDWRTGEVVAECPTHHRRVFCLDWSPGGEGLLVAGRRHCSFLTLDGRGFCRRPAVLGAEHCNSDILCSGWLRGEAVLGTSDGYLLAFEGVSVVSVKHAHKGPVFCAAPRFAKVPPAEVDAAGVRPTVWSQQQERDGLVTGGADGFIKIWSDKLEMLAQVDSASLPQCIVPCVRSVEYIPEPLLHASGAGDEEASAEDAAKRDQGRILLATAGGEIFEVRSEDGVDCTNEQVGGAVGPITQGHFAGECRALAAHPTAPILATAGDDATVRVWDLHARAMVASVDIESSSRAVAFHPRGLYLVIGLGGSSRDKSTAEHLRRDGTVLCISLRDMSVLREVRDGTHAVTCLRFNSDGSTLAVGTTDGQVYLYDTMGDEPSDGKESEYVPDANPWVLRGIATRHSLPVISLDFSTDGGMIRSSDAGGNVMFCSGMSGEALAATEAVETQWQTTTAPYGYDVQGAWPLVQDGSGSGPVVIERAPCGVSSRTAPVSVGTHSPDWIDLASSAHAIQDAILSAGASLEPASSLGGERISKRPPTWSLEDAGVAGAVGGARATGSLLLAGCGDGRVRLWPYPCVPSESVLSPASPAHVFDELQAVARSATATGWSGPQPGEPPLSKAMTGLASLTVDLSQALPGNIVPTASRTDDITILGSAQGSIDPSLVTSKVEGDVTRSALAGVGKPTTVESHGRQRPFWPWSPAMKDEDEDDDASVVTIPGAKPQVEARGPRQPVAVVGDGSHFGPVSSAVWIAGGKYVASLGAIDRCISIWRVVYPSEAEDTPCRLHAAASYMVVTNPTGEATLTPAAVSDDPDGMTYSAEVSDARELTRTSAPPRARDSSAVHSKIAAIAPLAIWQQGRKAARVGRLRDFEDWMPDRAGLTMPDPCFSGFASSLRRATPRPWMRTIVPPTSPVRPPPLAPQAYLRIEWVHGYSGRVGLRGSLGYSAHGRVVYPASSLSVVLDTKHQAQSFGPTGGGEVLGIALSPTGTVAATVSLVDAAAAVSLVEGRSVGGAQPLNAAERAKALATAEERAARAGLSQGSSVADSLSIDEHSVADKPPTARRVARPVITLWAPDGQDNTSLAQLAPVHQGSVAAMAFSPWQAPGPSGRGSGGDGSLGFGWDGTRASTPASGTQVSTELNEPSLLRSMDSAFGTVDHSTVGIPGAMGFGPDEHGGGGSSFHGGQLFAAVGDDDHHTLTVWRSLNGRWDDATEMGSVAVGSFDVAFLAFCIGTDNAGAHIVVGGDGCVVFVRVLEGSLRRMVGSFEPAGVRQTALCAAVIKRNLVIGMADGSVSAWSNGQCIKTSAAHSGPVTAMHSTGDLLVTGSTDGNVRVWAAGKVAGSLTVVTTIDLTAATRPKSVDPCVQAVALRCDPHRTTLLVGTRGNEVFEFVRPAGGGHGEADVVKALCEDPITVGGTASEGRTLKGGKHPRDVIIARSRRDSSVARLTSAHAGYEVQGLAPHPTEPDLLVTVGDDATLRLWSRSRRTQITSVALPGPSRAVCWSPTGDLLCVGVGARWGVGGRKGATAEDGLVVVLDSKTLRVVFRGRESRMPIGCLAFSPDGSILAAGSYDSKVYLYSVGYKAGDRPEDSGSVVVEQPSLMSLDGGSKAPILEILLRGVCEGCSGRVMALDFDESSQYVQANDSEGQLTFFSTHDGQLVAHPSDVRDAQWATWTLPAGWASSAAWPPPRPSAALRDSLLASQADCEVTSACADPLREFLVSGESTGRVQLFRFPAAFKDAQPRVSLAHGSPVRAVRFSCDGGHVFTVGGPDGVLVQWRLVRDEVPGRAPPLGPFPVILQPALG